MISGQFCLFFNITFTLSGSDNIDMTVRNFKVYSTVRILFVDIKIRQFTIVGEEKLKMKRNTTEIIRETPKSNGHLATIKIVSEYYIGILWQKEYSHESYFALLKQWSNWNGIDVCPLK